MKPKPIEVFEKVVPLSALDWQDNTFLTSYGRPLGGLLQSIQAIGLQQPPVLEAKRDGTYRILTGRRRLRALVFLGREQVSCRIAERGAALADLHLFHFFDNLGQRAFNLIEKSLLLKKLGPFFREDELLKEILPLLDLPPQKVFLKRCQWITDISPIFWPSVLRERLFPEVIETVQQAFPKYASLLLALFILVRWGFQKQKEFLKGLQEIVLRSQVPLETILPEMMEKTILADPGFTPQQKGEVLRKKMRTRLYPTLTGLEKDFHERVRRLGLDERTRLLPPPYFEGGRCDLTIFFSRTRELKESLERIGRILDKGGFDDFH